MTGARRELTVAVLLCAVGGGLALWATTREWAVLVTARPAPLPPVRDVVSGGDAAPLAAALALVGLAGAAALLAARGFLRVLVGLLLLLAGAGVAAGGVSVLTDGVAGAQVATDVRLAAGWPALCAVGGLLVAGGGILATVRGRRWSALGRRYDAPGTESRAGQDTPMWDSLDRGEDPTAP
jgi:hypothetical protein